MFKFRVNPQQVATLELKVRGKLKETLGDPALMTEIGDFTKARIVYQARVAKPITQAGVFEPLSPAWIKKRGELAKNNQTQATYSKARSNLTLTGQFLDSYDYDVTGVAQLTFEFKGTHRGYRSATGKTGKPVPNKTIAEGLKDQGREVVDRSIETNKLIVARIKSIALRFLRRSLRP